MGVESMRGTPEQLDLTPSPRLLEVLGDLPYKPWQCLAELIDNAFDDFLSNPDPQGDRQPTVRVTLPKPSTADPDAEVCVADSGRGMSADRLQNALKAGYSANARYGNLGLFGMGFNIATARLGHLTEVRTTRAGDAEWLVAEIDFQAMRSSNDFKVPLRREPKDDVLLHGTEIVVRRLKPEIRDSLRRSNTSSGIREKLGNVYSYLLRSEAPIPEMPDSSLAGRGFQLYVNNRRVKPRLPCVWSAHRSVDYRGAPIQAIQTVERELPDAYACMACGHWHRVETNNCVECQSEDLELRSRKIRGWLGIQRYLDVSDFGIDFLRNGRKILVADKSLFTWENIDTDESFVEYPIELPANQGRIVGEVHLDHVPVFYQKTDFDKTSRDWNDAVIVIRGDAPLQPEKARKREYSENGTPLALLFKGFRRNDPGPKCLIPGNGDKATHEQARKWGEDFRKGLPDYLTDHIWYQAVLDHQAIKDDVRNPGDQASQKNSATHELSKKTGLDDPLAPDQDESDRAAATIPSQSRSTRGETDEERYARYRAESRMLLRGDFTLSSIGKRNVSIYETSETLQAADGIRVPCVIYTPRGPKIEIYVDGKHEVFREYGREPRDFAIAELADHLRTVSNTKERITALAAEVIRQLPDQRITDAALRERAEAILFRIRELLSPLSAAHAKDLWAKLPQEGKLLAEREAASLQSKLDWRAATESGEFASYLDGASIAELVRARPDLLLDGGVFTSTYSSWSDEATRERQASRVARLLDTVAEFIASKSIKGRLELSSTRLTLEMLDDELRQAE
ncbi:ATP-binding protein [Streptomyces sp. NPDC056982]|uniref:ATP-binding protein n=1 Tax=Streptomyces sp. NPDC056982 TaxID=3345986 RepID=UPI0036283A83